MDLQFYIDKAPTPERQQLLRRQWTDAVKENCIICPGCGYVRCLKLAYKCLYCGLWYCFGCAEKHFGKTFDEWHKENP